MASSCRWAVRVSSAGGSSKTSESRQPPDTTGVEGLRTTPFLGWLLIRIRSGWIPTRNVARISVRNCTHISTKIGTASDCSQIVLSALSRSICVKIRHVPVPPPCGQEMHGEDGEENSMKAIGTGEESRPDDRKARGPTGSNCGVSGRQCGEVGRVLPGISNRLVHEVELTNPAGGDRRAAERSGLRDAAGRAGR